MNAIEKAIELAGGVSALADRLKESPQTIVNWRKRQVPAEKVLALESATIDPDTGIPRITRHQIRDDLYPEQSA